jgi:hypothetical protein
VGGSKTFREEEKDDKKEMSTDRGGGVMWNLDAPGWGSAG